MSKQPRPTNAEYLRALRADAVARGLCYVCRCRFPRPGIRNCDECLARKATTEKRLVAERRCTHCCAPIPPQRRALDCQACSKRKSAKHGAKRRAAIARGVCGRCKRNPLADGATACVLCLDTERDRQIKMRDKASRATGVPHRYPCSSCGELGHYRQTCARRKAGLL